MIKKVYSVFLALLPIISLYRMPIFSINAGLFVLLLFSALHALLFISAEGQRVKGKALPMIFFTYILLCAVFVRLTNPAMLTTSVYYRLAIFFAIVIPAWWAASMRLVDFALMRKTVEIVSLVAALCIFYQYANYYLLGKTLGYGRVWLLPFRMQLADLYYMGKEMVPGGLFRPSAFFLEPAHYAQYGIIALASILIPSDRGPVQMPKAILLSFGLLLSTSGMAIVLTAFMWIYFAQSRSSRQNRLLIIIGAAVALLVVFVVLYQFEFFGAALSRFISDGESGESAYTGRLYTFYYYEELGALAKWVGVGFQNLPIYTTAFYGVGTYYMVGIVELLYCLGYLGTALCLLTLMDGILNTRGFPQCVAILYLSMVFVAARLKTVDVVFYLTIVYGGYGARQPVWRSGKHPGDAIMAGGRRTNL